MRKKHVCIFSTLLLFIIMILSSCSYSGEQHETAPETTPLPQLYMQENQACLIMDYSSSDMGKMIFLNNDFVPYLAITNSRALYIEESTILDMKGLLPVATTFGNNIVCGLYNLETGNWQIKPSYSNILIISGSRDYQAVDSSGNIFVISETGSTLFNLADNNETKQYISGKENNAYIYKYKEDYILTVKGSNTFYFLNSEGEILKKSAGSFICSFGDSIIVKNSEGIVVACDEKLEEVFNFGGSSSEFKSTGNYLLAFKASGSSASEFAIYDSEFNEVSPGENMNYTLLSSNLNYAGAYENGILNIFSFTDGTETEITINNFEGVTVEDFSSEYVIYSNDGKLGLFGRDGNSLEPDFSDIDVRDGIIVCEKITEIEQDIFISTAIYDSKNMDKLYQSSPYNEVTVVSDKLLCVTNDESTSVVDYENRILFKEQSSVQDSSAQSTPAA